MTLQVLSSLWQTNWTSCTKYWHTPLMFYDLWKTIWAHFIFWYISPLTGYGIPNWQWPNMTLKHSTLENVLFTKTQFAALCVWKFKNICFHVLELLWGQYIFRKTIPNPLLKEKKGKQLKTMIGWLKLKSSQKSCVKIGFVSKTRNISKILQTILYE